MRQSLFYPVVAGSIAGMSIGSLFSSGFLIIVWIGLSFLAILWALVVGRTYENTASSLLLPGSASSPLSSSPEFRQYSILFYITVGIFFAALGTGRFFLTESRIEHRPLDTMVGKTVYLEGVVSDEPAQNNASLRVVATISSARLLRGSPADSGLFNSAASPDDALLAGSPKATFSVNAYLPVKYGDKITVIGTLQKPAPFQTDSGSTFLYDKYLAVQGIFYTLYKPTVRIIAPGQGSFIRTILFKTKQAFVAQLGKVIPFPESRLAAGLTVAGKEALPADILDDFTRSGTIQVVVLSGYNVTIVAELIAWLCQLFSPTIAAFAATFGIILFCILAGGTATIVRGGIMAVTVIAAKLFHRQYNVYRAFWLSAFVMLLLNPLLADYDPSFQYSFVATAGLIYGSMMFVGIFRFLPERFGIRQTAAATTATQIFVLPLALYSTGQISLAALPANLLLFLLMPLTMLACFISALLGFVSPLLAIPAAWPAWLLLTYELGVVHFFAAIPLTFLTIPSFPLSALLICYGCYVAVLWWRRDIVMTQKSKSKKGGIDTNVKLRRETQF